MVSKPKACPTKSEVTKTLPLGERIDLFLGLLRFQEATREEWNEGLGCLHSFFSAKIREGLPGT